MAEVFRIFGADPSVFEPTYESFLEFIHPDDRSSVDECYKESLKNDSDSYQIEHRIIKRNTGNTIYVLEKSINVRSAEGIVVASLGIVQDITRIRKVEDDLKEKNRMLNVLLEMMQGVVYQAAEEKVKEKTAELQNFFSVALDLLCIADLSGNFIKLNKSWENVLGYPVAELGHMNFLDFIHPEDLKPTLDAMDILDDQEPIINFTNRYRTKDGNYRFIEWRCVPVGKLLYASARDITDRIHAEKDINSARAEADRANSAKSQFLVQKVTR